MLEHQLRMTKGGYQVAALRVGWSFGKLEVDSQGDLSGSVFGIFRSRSSGQLAKGGGTIHRRCRRGEVGMVQDVGEG